MQPNLIVYTFNSKPNALRPYLFILAELQITAEHV